MLVGLGFLGALLLGLVVLPAYRRRMVRLTTLRIKRAMPLTEDEIRADKDRLRAEFAMVIHELDAKLEKGSLAVARQRVDINRRDAAISGLEGEVERMRTSLEEHENARRVLEHTIMDRLPKVELRLLEARKLLTQRDREIVKLAATGDKQAQALEETTQINSQHRDEIHRLNAALATRAARNRDGMGDRRFDGEVALRSEIEALRAKTRDQASLVARLQGLLGRSGGSLVGAPIGKSGTAGALAASNGAAGADNGDVAQSGPLHMNRSEEEIAQLQNALGEAEAALRSVRSSEVEGEAGRSALENELRVLKSENEDLTAEVAQVNATLKAYQDAESNDKAIFDSKVSMKVRISALTAKSEEQSATVARLRAEVAAGNEKLARQSSHFMEEMRRLGAGTMPAVGPAADPRVGGRGGGSGQRSRTLSDRISDPRHSSQSQRVTRGSPVGEVVGSVAGASGTASNGVREPAGKASGLMNVLVGSKSVAAAAGASAGGNSGIAGGSSAEVSKPVSEDRASSKEATALADQKSRGTGSVKDRVPGATSGKTKVSGASSQKSGGLLERITRMSGSK